MDPQISNPDLQNSNPYQKFNDVPNQDVQPQIYSNDATDQLLNAK